MIRKLLSTDLLVIGIKMIADRIVPIFFTAMQTVIRAKMCAGHIL